MNGEGRAELLADLVRGVTGPVTAVFGTFDYRKLVDRWIEHARTAGCRDYRTCCAVSGWHRQCRAGSGCRSGAGSRARRCAGAAAGF